MHQTSKYSRWWVTTVTTVSGGVLGFACQFCQAQNGGVIANFQINITAKHYTKNRQYRNRFLILTV